MEKGTERRIDSKINVWKINLGARVAGCRLDISPRQMARGYIIMVQMMTGQKIMSIVNFVSKMANLLKKI